MKIIVRNLSNKNITLSFKGNVIQLKAGDNALDLDTSLISSLRSISYLRISQNVSQSEVKTDATISHAKKEIATEAPVASVAEEVLDSVIGDTVEETAKAEAPIEVEPSMEETLPIADIVEYSNLKTSELRELFLERGLNPKGVRRSDLISNLENM